MADIRQNIDTQEPILRGNSGAGGALGIGVVLVVFAVAMAVALWVGSGVLSYQAREQGAHTLRQTVMDAAMQCFAIEGCYPVDVEYLEDNYGLSINHNEYIVLYEVFASNVPPSVSVRVK